MSRFQTSRAFAPLCAFSLAFIAGCNPQSASLEGATFRTFLAVSTSPTYLNDQLGLNEDEKFLGEGEWSPDAPYKAHGVEHYQIDCRADIPDEDLLPKAESNFKICNTEGVF